MSIVDRWLLPDGVEDVLPPQAAKLEAARRRLLDLYAQWGYDYVIPPMIEFLESLLTGTGRDLDLKTLKVVDLITGRTMGVRADITPQVARIDAHSLNQEGVVRLCYAGTVIHARPDNMLANRAQLSVGAELFGASGDGAFDRGDIEIVSLMVESLKSLGFTGVHVDLGDVAIFRQLVDSLSLNEVEQELLFESVQRKSVAEIREHGEMFGLDKDQVRLLSALPGLTGDETMLEGARELFAGYDGILECIDNLATVAAAISERFSSLKVYFDLSELRGYAYHTGIVFAAHVDGVPQVIAKGGRYDHIGQVFGRAGRGATGFTINLHPLIEHLAGEGEPPRRVVVTADIEGEAGLWEEVQRLRQEGMVVVESGETRPGDLRLTVVDGQWQLIGDQ